jgi:hypothetical protein
MIPTMKRNLGTVPKRGTYQGTVDYPVTGAEDMEDAAKVVKEEELVSNVPCPKEVNQSKRRPMDHPTSVVESAPFGA